MKARNKAQVMWQLIQLVKPLTLYMVAAIVMGLIGHLCAAFISILGGYALLNALDFTTLFTMSFIVIGLLLLAFLRGVLRYGEQACNHFIAFKLLALIRDKVFTVLRKLAPAKLEGRDKGDLIALITSDIELLEVFYAHTISPVMIAFLFSLVLSIYIGQFHYSLAIWLLLAHLCVGVLIPSVVNRLNQDYGLQFRHKAGELSSFVLDSLRGLPEILQYHQGEKRLQMLKQKSDALCTEEKRMKHLLGWNQAITNAVILFFDLGILFWCVFLYQHEIIAFDGVLLSTLTLMSSFGPVTALANLGSTLQNTLAAGDRVLDLLEELPVVEDIFNGEEVDAAKVTANQVRFAYDKEMILDDVSISIDENAVIGIKGKSGSGKSTLLKLLMRFWDVQKGNILIGDTPISQINTSSIRELESYVTQETHIFHDTIRNNLKIAKMDASEEEIISACKKASVHDFIMSLPKEYDTMVEELGETLSGGERQRIGLARAFLHGAPLLLLDEPTSNLDGFNEAVILKALQKEKKDKTIVLVSHRDSTMKVADQIYHMKEGRMS